MVNCRAPIWMESSEHGKTLRLCSEESVYGSKLPYGRRLNNMSYKAQHENSGCKTTEPRGRLVKMTEMDKPPFEVRSRLICERFEARQITFVEKRTSRIRLHLTGYKA